MQSYVPAGPGPASPPWACTTAPPGYGALPVARLGVPAALAGSTMGTTWSARMALPPGLSAQVAQVAIQGALDLVVAQMSTWEDDSDLSRYNRAPAGWQALPDDCLHVLRHALALANETNGAFDPTVGPLVNAWGFGPPPHFSEPPSAATLQAAAQRCGWQRVSIDVAGKQAWQPGGAFLDLSGIAKGYGVDQAARALERLGVTNYLIEVGGELRARGRRPDIRPWHVAIEVPDASDGHILALPLHDLSIATSGDYRRYRQTAGGRHAHTLDPRTGQPVANDVASVTVIHKSCMQADALATALTVMGLQAGMSYARQIGLAALFIQREAKQFRLAASDAFAGLTGLRTPS